MSAVNTFLAGLVDVVLSPFERQPPLVGLTAVSLALALMMLAVVRATSNQARVVAVKRAIQACVFEIRLFNDDLAAMCRALAELARHNLTYLRLSLVPVLWMAIPIGLLIAHLHFHYGFQGLNVGHAAVVKVTLKHPQDRAGAGPILTVPAGIRLETPAVWIPSLREAAWRISAERPGSYELTVTVEGDAFTKSLQVSDGTARRSPRRPGAGLLDELANPAEPPLPRGASVESIAVTYPPRGIELFGFELHWLVVLLGLSTVFAFVLRRPFRVVL
jgi:hypothetical protein